MVAKAIPLEWDIPFEGFTLRSWLRRRGVPMVLEDKEVFSHELQLLHELPLFDEDTQFIAVLVFGENSPQVS
jgi:hypothetical protein